MAPIDFQDFIASEEARREAWRRRFAMEDTFRDAEPNRGHRAVQFQQIDRLDLRAELTPQACHVEGGRVQAHVVEADQAHTCPAHALGGPGGASEADHALDVHRRVWRVEQIGEPKTPAFQRKAQRCRSGARRRRDQCPGLGEAAVAVEDDGSIAERQQHAGGGPVLDPVDDVGDQEVPAPGAELGHRALDVIH